MDNTPKNPDSEYERVMSAPYKSLQEITDRSYDNIKEIVTLKGGERFCVICQKIIRKAKKNERGRE